MLGTIRSATALVVIVGLSSLAAQVPLSKYQQLEAVQAIEVDVIGADQKGIPDMNVSLTDLEGGGVKTGLTDSSGCVRFVNAPDGTYRVNVKGPGIEDRGTVFSFIPGASRWITFWVRYKDGKVVEIEPCHSDCWEGPLSTPVTALPQNDSPHNSEPVRPCALAPVKGRVCLSEGVLRGFLIQSALPKLPKGADENGAVLVHVVVPRNGGKPSKISTISGDPALRIAAVRAVHEWVFMSYLYKGEAVEMEGDLHVLFKPTQ